MLGKKLVGRVKQTKILIDAGLLDIGVGPGPGDFGVLQAIGASPKGTQAVAIGELFLQGRQNAVVQDKPL